MHGILGSQRNWHSFATQLVAKHPSWQFVLVDLRNHGKSQGAPPPHTLAACVADLNALSRKLSPPVTAIFGHSFGGKVALSYKENYADELVQVWILDSPPGANPITLSEPHPVTTVLRALRDVPMPSMSRSSVIAALESRGLSKPIALWLSMNVVRDGDTVQWRFNLDDIEAMLASYFATNHWPALEEPKIQRLHIVRGDKSDRWNSSDIERINSLTSEQLKFHTLENAGHWLHVDNPQGLLDLIGGVL